MEQKVALLLIFARLDTGAKTGLIKWKCLVISPNLRLKFQPDRTFSFLVLCICPFAIARYMFVPSNQKITILGHKIDKIADICVPI